MAYIGIILNFQYKFQFKRSPELQNGGHFEIFWNVFDRLILTSYPERSLQNIPEKVCLTQVTSSVTSQRNVKFNLLYSSLNEITTFFTITIKRFDVWSPNCMCRCTIGDDDVIDITIKSKSRSTFWTSVTLLIFKANLECQTNTQNVGNWTGYLDVILISKSSQSLQLSSLCYELSSCWKFWQVRNLWLLFHPFLLSEWRLTNEDFRCNTTNMDSSSLAWYLGNHHCKHPATSGISKKTWMTFFWITRNTLASLF